MFKVGQRRWVIGFIAAMMILLALAVVSYRRTKQLASAAQKVAHTQEILKTLNNLQAGVMEAESSTRGYVITGEESYIDSYHVAVSSIEFGCKEIRRLTADSINQQQRLDALEPVIKEKTTVMREIMFLRRNYSASVGNKRLSCENTSERF